MSSTYGRHLFIGNIWIVSTTHTYSTLSLYDKMEKDLNLNLKSFSKLKYNRSDAPKLYVRYPAVSDSPPLHILITGHKR